MGLAGFGSSSSWWWWGPSSGRRFFGFGLGWQRCFVWWWEGGGTGGSPGAVLRGGGAHPERFLSQAESPPSWPSMTTSPGPKRTCPSRKENASKLSTTRECPCAPVAKLHPLERAPEGSPSPASGRPAVPRDTPRGISEPCVGTVTCPRPLASETIAWGMLDAPPSSCPRCWAPLPRSPATTPPPRPRASPQLGATSPPAPRPRQRSAASRLPGLAPSTPQMLFSCFRGACDLSFPLDCFSSLLPATLSLGGKWTSGVYRGLVLLLLPTCLVKGCPRVGAGGSRGCLGGLCPATFDLPGRAGQHTEPPLCRRLCTREV